MTTCLYKRLKCFKNINEFLCIYLGEGRGCTNARICIGTHSQSLLRNHLMDFAKTWYGWRTSLTCLRHFGQIRPGKDPGRSQNRLRGPLLKKTFSSVQTAIAINRTHSNDLEACAKKCCYCWFHSEVKFLTRFDFFLVLVILPYLNDISTDNDVVKIEML